VIIGVDAIKPFLQLGVISGILFTFLLQTILKILKGFFFFFFQFFLFEFAADGKELVHKVDLKLNRSSICHEIGVTQRYLID
jgi:hypothetical protein